MEWPVKFVFLFHQIKEPCRQSRALLFGPVLSRLLELIYCRLPFAYSTPPIATKDNPTSIDICMKDARMLSPTLGRPKSSIWVESATAGLTTSAAGKGLAVIEKFAISQAAAYNWVPPPSPEPVEIITGSSGSDVSVTVSAIPPLLSASKPFLAAFSWLRSESINIF